LLAFGEFGVQFHAVYIDRLKIIALMVVIPCSDLRLQVLGAQAGSNRHPLVPLAYFKYFESDIFHFQHYGFLAFFNDS
jgi:hypothetical protein